MSEFIQHWQTIPNQIRARWPRDRSDRRAITEAEQRSQRSVMGWVTKFYYLELLRASEDTLSRFAHSSFKEG
jgi:hypothetical protein